MTGHHDLLPSDTTLGAVHLQVADVERSLAYYEGVLGLRALEQASDRASLVAGEEGGPVLVSLHRHAGAHPAPRRARLGLYHFAILLPDRPALGRFVAHLQALGERAGASDHLVSEALYLTDPDGLGIEVYADRPRSAWEWRGGELVMATNPLDLDDLAAAGGREHWRGMPPGTRVGHMHLHVGDLAEAAGFYQRGLGLEATVRSYPGALFLAAGGYHHHLGLNTWAGPAAAPPAPDDARLLAWTLVVPEPSQRDAAAGRLEAGGHPVAREGEGWRLTDPWGTVLRLAPSASALDAARRRRT